MPAPTPCLATKKSKKMPLNFSLREVQAKGRGLVKRWINTMPDRLYHRKREIVKWSKNPRKSVKQSTLGGLILVERELRNWLKLDGLK